VVRVLIHSALSTDIHEKMKYHRYNRSIHRGKDIVDLAKRSVKVISGNMDRLYNNMWKDLRLTDFPTWAAFVAEFRKLYEKLKESGQEVTLKSSCIHLFEKVRTFLPIWTEINESQYYSQPNVKKLLLELETHGRQLEYDGITVGFALWRTGYCYNNSHVRKLG
jgi:flagellin-specific chaperone FliS